MALSTDSQQHWTMSSASRRGVGPGPGCRCWSLVTDGSESDILSPGRKPDQDKELTQACSRSTPVSIDYI